MNLQQVRVHPEVSEFQVRREGRSLGLLFVPGSRLCIVLTNPAVEYTLSSKTLLSWPTEKALASQDYV